MTTSAPFPASFVWGAATSAYQIEGGIDSDGRGESIWDRFCATPGRIKDGTDGAVACDFYGRHSEDVGLMRSLGIDAFRFSVAWPRVIPDGRGRVNARGLDFYDRLLDELLAAGIEPYVNLFHWDLPQPLQDAGGWPLRSTAQAFAEYAAAVGARLGDRVGHWITHNEPACASWLGHCFGVHAPGHRSVREALAAAHHLLLSHGWAVEELRRCAPGAEIGIVVDSWPAYPWTDSPEDRAAARLVDGMMNRWFFDALFRGEYPADMLEHFGSAVPSVDDGDFGVIGEPLDFVGANNYSRRFVRANPEGGLPLDVRAAAGELTAMGWEVYPAGIREVLTRLHRDYGVESLFVAENGAAFGDVRTHDGRVHDVDRIKYLEAYLGEVASAMAEGVPIRGYFVWSLLDNFEWAEGYSKRFGLVFVDYPTLQRIPKDSFYWYRDLIARSRGVTLAA
jgi:beta-glucosidase